MRGTRMAWSRAGRLAAVLTVILAMAAFAAVGPAAAQDDESVVFDLNELNASGVTGTATLTADGDRTNVVLDLSGDAIVGEHPAHNHEGTCDDLDPNPTYPLSEVDEEGQSETNVEVSLDDLTGDTPYAINVHLSNEEIGVYIACGDITNFSSGDVAVGGGNNEVATTTTAPTSGAGAAFRAAGHRSLVAGFAALAGMLAAGGLALRGREGRR